MIRKATPEDFDFLYYLYMHPQVNPYLLYEWMSPDHFKVVFNELQEKELLYIFEEAGEAVGMFKLVPQKYRNTHIVYLGGVAIDPVHAGKGWGKKMMELIKTHVKQTGFLRIELTVATGNERAIQLYLNTGFQLEGILKKYSFLKSRNQFVDEAVMAYLI